MRKPEGPTLVVLAAGVGRRFGGLKQLEPLGPSGETLLEYSIFDAARAGFARAVIVVRAETRDEFRETVEARVAGWLPLTFALQSLDDLPEGFDAPPGRTRPWGTGHAVWACRDLLDGPFAVVNADDFYGFDAIRAVGGVPETDLPVLAGYRLRDTLPETGAVSRALCRVDEAGRLRAIEEILAIERDGDGGRYVADDGTTGGVPGDALVSMNLWGFAHDFLQTLGKSLREFLVERGDSHDAELLLPQIIGDLLQKGSGRVRVVPVHGRWCGITRPSDLRGAKDFLQGLVDRGDYPTALWP